MIHLAIAVLKTFAWLGLLGAALFAVVVVGASLGTSNGYVTMLAVGVGLTYFFAGALGWAILLVLAYLAERIVAPPRS